MKKLEAEKWTLPDGVRIAPYTFEAMWERAQEAGHLSPTFPDCDWDDSDMSVAVAYRTEDIYTGEPTDIVMMLGEDLSEEELKIRVLAGVMYTAAHEAMERTLYEGKLVVDPHSGHSTTELVQALVDYLNGRKPHDN